MCDLFFREMDGFHFHLIFATSRGDDSMVYQIKLSDLYTSWAHWYHYSLNLVSS